VVDQAPNKHKAPDANSSLSLSHHSPKVTFASGGLHAHASSAYGYDAARHRWTPNLSINLHSIGPPGWRGR